MFAVQKPDVGGCRPTGHKWLAGEGGTAVESWVWLKALPLYSCCGGWESQEEVTRLEDGKGAEESGAA